MNSKTISRLAALEWAAGADLPLVLCIGGGEAPASCWNRGTAKEEADAINATVREIRDMLEHPAPNRNLRDFE